MEEKQQLARRTKYYTKGELLPWKGKFLRLENIDTETGYLTFSPAGETAGELKRKLAEEKRNGTSNASRPARN